MLDSKSRYNGDVKNCLRHGNGSYDYPGGIYHYKGPWVSGVKNGKQGSFSLPGLFSYVGDFTNGEMTGSGVKKWDDGRTYEGTMLNGEMHGKGKLTGRDGGEVYIGDFDHNRRHGSGMLQHNGSVFQGGFKEHKFDSNGTFLKENRYFFEGSFEKGIIEGPGKASWHKALIYEGMWNNGAPFNNGYIMATNDSFEYKGLITNSCPDVAASEIKVEVMNKNDRKRIVTLPPSEKKLSAQQLAEATALATLSAPWSYNPGEALDGVLLSTLMSLAIPAKDIPAAPEKPDKNALHVPPATHHNVIGPVQEITRKFVLSLHPVLPPASPREGEAGDVPAADVLGDAVEIWERNHALSTVANRSSRFPISVVQYGFATTIPPPTEKAHGHNNHHETGYEKYTQDKEFHYHVYPYAPSFTASTSDLQSTDTSASHDNQSPKKSAKGKRRKKEAEVVVMPSGTDRIGVKCCHLTNGTAACTSPLSTADIRNSANALDKLTMAATASDSGSVSGTEDRPSMDKSNDNNMTMLCDFRLDFLEIAKEYAKENSPPRLPSFEQEGSISISNSPSGICPARSADGSKMHEVVLDQLEGEVDQLASEVASPEHSLCSKSSPTRSPYYEVPISTLVRNVNGECCESSCLTLYLSIPTDTLIKCQKHQNKLAEAKIAAEEPVEVVEEQPAVVAPAKSGSVDLGDVEDDEPTEEELEEQRLEEERLLQEQKEQDAVDRKEQLDAFVAWANENSSIPCLWDLRIERKDAPATSMTSPTNSLVELASPTTLEAVVDADAEPSSDEPVAERAGSEDLGAQEEHVDVDAEEVLNEDVEPTVSDAESSVTSISCARWIEPSFNFMHWHSVALTLKMDVVDGVNVGEEETAEPKASPQVVDGEYNAVTNVIELTVDGHGRKRYAGVYEEGAALAWLPSDQSDEPDAKLVYRVGGIGFTGFVKMMTVFSSHHLVKIVDATSCFISWYRRREDENSANDNDVIWSSVTALWYYKTVSELPHFPPPPEVEEAVSGKKEKGGKDKKGDKKGAEEVVVAQVVEKPKEFPPNVERDFTVVSEISVVCRSGYCMIEPDLLILPQDLPVGLYALKVRDAVTASCFRPPAQAAPAVEEDGSLAIAPEEPSTTPVLPHELDDYCQMVYELPANTSITIMVAEKEVIA